MYIALHVGPLLGNNLETNNETTPAARLQIPNKRVLQLLLGNASQTNMFPWKQLEYNE
jgi:hypothetical protein